MNIEKIRLSSLNNKLFVSKAIIDDSIDIKRMNLSDDIYLNNSIYTPVGSILTYAGSSAPSGWLLCNGNQVSKTDYPRLFSVINNRYGNPDISTNFVLPDLTDRVPIGKSGSTNLGNSGGNSTITLSTEQLPTHTHTGTTVSNGTHSHTGTTDNNGSHTHGVTDNGHFHSVQDAFFAENQQNGANNLRGTSANTDSDNTVFTRNIFTGSSTTGISVNPAGDHAHGFTTQTAGDHTHSFTTNSTGNSSSIDIRNKFIILNYIIRY
jgi:microcystin-dependent protein